MKKRFLALLLLPLLISGCNGASNESFNSETINHPRKTGEIGEFGLTSPFNGFSTNTGFTFTWEEASNCDYYQLEIASTINFINDDDSKVYTRESNISLPSFELKYSLPKKDILYYWRVTAINKDHTKKCKEVGNFFYESIKVDEIPIAIEDADDWVLHKEGSYADISIDRTNFFGNGKDSLSIVFDKEHTSQGIPKSDGWIVVTKTEDRELYGTDSFYFNFYYSGHDSTVLVRVLDYDGEYWHKQIQVSNNAKQTIVVKYEDFELRTSGTNIFNRVFDWQHIRYFEIVFERTFGDGICLFSDIKGVKFDDYRGMFMDKMDFNSTDMSAWTYENFNFEKTISDDGNEITLGYQTGNGFNGYGFQNINVYKFFVDGDALRMQVKYTGTGSNAVFYFRVLEEDGDRWQFKTPFSYFVRDEYKELIIPLKAFQRTDYMAGDGGKQFFFIQKFNIGLADNYTSGTISVKDLEVIHIDDVVESRTKVVSDDGCIEDFSEYNIYTEIYYYWLQSSVNKDEAMKLDNIHKVGGNNNPYCAEFDYKADMEQAQYQLYIDASEVENKNAFSIWLRDASPKSEDAAVSYLDEKDVAAEMTIQLTMDSGEWYRYVIDKVDKDWKKYTIPFEKFFLFNEDSLFDDPNPLSVEHIIHLGFGFQYFYKDQSGKGHPTYAIANPVYIDEIYFTNTMAADTTIEEIEGTIKPSEEDPDIVLIDDMESYASSEEIFNYWSYGLDWDYNELALAEEVSKEGGSHSIKMHYKGSDSVSYVRTTQLSSKVKAKALSIDIRGDGKATIHLNLNWRSGNTLYKMRYTIYNAKNRWVHYLIGFELFEDINGSKKVISSDKAKDIESISFGIVRKDLESDIYVDNMILLNNVEYNVDEQTPIPLVGQEGGEL